MKILRQVGAKIYKTQIYKTYTWKDTTAKPNTVYYYRIEDVSHAGVREQLATVRLKGLVSASGKRTTKWADLKRQTGGSNPTQKIDQDGRIPP